MLLQVGPFLYRTCLTVGLQGREIITEGEKITFQSVCVEIHGKNTDDHDETKREDD